MAELWALWRQIRLQLSDDRQAELVEQTLLQMRRAFDSGDKQGGRDAIWSLRLCACADCTKVRITGKEGRKVTPGTSPACMPP